MTRWTGLAMVGLLAMAACSPGGGNGTSGGPDTTISVADLPHVRAGYWERVETTNGQRPRPPTSATPASPSTWFGHKECSSFILKRTFLGAVVTDATCASGPVASTMHMSIGGDFNASYTSDGQMTITLQGKPPQNFTLHTVTRYLGACPAGNSTDG